MIDPPYRARGAAAARGLVMLRLVVGGIFLYAGVGKLTLYTMFDFLPVPVVSLQWQLELPARLATWLATHPSGPMAAVVRDLLMPHGIVVAAVVAWGQTITGVLLVVGAFTTVASLLGIVIAITLALAASSRGLLDARQYILLVALCVSFIVGQAGEVAGMDSWRRERRRNRDL